MAHRFGDRRRTWSGFPSGLHAVSVTLAEPGESAAQKLEVTLHNSVCRCRVTEVAGGPVGRG